MPKYYDFPLNDVNADIIM